MIGNEILLDTNIIIDLFKGDTNISYRLDQYRIVNIPITVLGELYVGAYRSFNPTKHLKKIKNFMRRCKLLSSDHETADHYGIIKASLFKKGKPIPENDIWIAASAKQNDLVLISRDHHFREVDDLRWEEWKKII